MNGCHAVTSRCHRQQEDRPSFIELQCKKEGVTAYGTAGKDTWSINFRFPVPISTERTTEFFAYRLRPFVKRPESRYGRYEVSMWVNTMAQKWNDVDNFLRAILNGLVRSGIMRDDSDVTSVYCEKRRPSFFDAQEPVEDITGAVTFFRDRGRPNSGASLLLFW